MGWEKLIAGEGVASAAHVQLRSTLRYSHANGELLTSFGQAFPKAPVHNFNEEDERKPHASTRPNRCTRKMRPSPSRWKCDQGRDTRLGCMANLGSLSLTAIINK